MDQQQIYLDLESYNGLRLMQQDEQLQQQQQQQYQPQGIIMDTQQEIIVQEADQNNHVVYSPIKQNDQQYIQQQDDSMQPQYLIQSSPQQSQQVFYANISPPNQNRLNHGLISQGQNQQKLVLQSPKVVVQRNTDMLQTATNMAQIVDQQNQQIQYFAPQMDQGQQPQLIVQPQQIKQTIYPHQVVSQPHYFQLQQIQQPQIVQQSGAKIVMQGSPVRYSFVQKQPQQQIMQLHQQPQQMQTQQSPRPFTPRMLTSTPVRIRVQSPQLQQPQQQPRPRLPSKPPRIVRPTAHNPLISQFNPQPRQQQTNKIVYIIQTQPDGSQILVPHSQYNQSEQPQQVVRMVQQKVQQPTQSQIPELVPQSKPAAEEIHTPTTSTFTPKKDGDCDDLEESITATAISKSTRSEPPPLAAQSGVQMTLEEYRKRGIQQNQSRVGVVKPIMNNQRPQVRNPALQVIRQRPQPRAQFQQSGVASESSERESAKMLVILDNGEQRLITFTLPKETCTVQELLDQVGIHVGADSNIECIENPGSEIDYIVKVGNFASRDTAAMTKAAENHIRQQQQRLVQSQRNNIMQQQQVMVQQQPEGDLTKSKSPELKLPPARHVPGYYAVCTACGFSGADHAKCERCHRIFTEDPKQQKMPMQSVQKGLPLQTISTTTQSQKIITSRIGNLDKKDQIEALQKKHQMATARQAAGRGRGGILSTAPRGGRAPRAPRKPAVQEIVTLSSDDEDTPGSKPPPPLMRKPFEPEIVEDVVEDDFVRHDVTEFSENETNNKLQTNFSCRTIRIGSYKFDSKEKVAITTKGIKIVAPNLKNPKDMIVLNIQHSEIVKVVVHFSKQLHIIFLYTKPSCARYIVEQLQMTLVNEKSPFFSPISRSEPQKKIVFLAESINEEARSTIKSIYPKTVLEEITNRDANEMLVRSTGIPLPAPSPAATPNTTAESSSFLETDKTLLIYPPGRGGLTIKTNDYICLGSDNYLNDVIIDFYLDYLRNEILTEEQRQKTHIFSQFFYKRLTMLVKEKDPKLTAAQKRHARVAAWTKNVNLFEKDNVIIPINEQSHWFLAIICFPNLTEAHTMDGNQPIKLVPQQKRAKKKATSVQIGNTTITPMTKKEETINLGDDENEERDEAEGDDSDLGSNLESEEDEEVMDEGQAVKLPCILIFDSLLGAPRSRVVATLRDYLTCEYKAKFPNAPPRIYTKMTIFGNQVKVPQQNNFTDCGLFLLQYVEQFFKDPIKDFRIPIKSLTNWFHQDVVTRKREEIAKLIQELIKRTTPDGIELPELEFPTKDGKILEHSEDPNESLVEAAFNDDDYVPTEEDLKELSQNGSKILQEETKRVFLPKKRSLEKNDNSSAGESASKTPKFSKK